MSSSSSGGGNSKCQLSSPTTTTLGMTSPFEVSSTESKTHSATHKMSLTNVDSTSGTLNKAYLPLKALGGFGDSKYFIKISVFAN